MWRWLSLLLLLVSKGVRAVKFSVTSECPKLPFDEVMIVIGPCVPFRVVTHSEAVFIQVDRSAGLKGLPEKVSDGMDDTLIRVLVLLRSTSPLGDSELDLFTNKWGIDVIVVQGPTTAPLSDDMVAVTCIHDSCSFDTAELVPGKTVWSRLGSCESTKLDLTSVPSLSASVEIVSGSIIFCVVKIDSRIAHFDAQLEWLQATLSEHPCRSSDFTIVTFKGGNLDSEVVDLLSAHAMVDLIVSDDPKIRIPMRGVPLTQDGVLGFTKDGQITYSPATCNSVSSPDQKVFFPSRRNDRMSSYPMIAVYSDTPTSDVIFSIVVALLSGLMVNVAFRRSLLKRRYEAIPAIS